MGDQTLDVLTNRKLSKKGLFVVRQVRAFFLGYEATRGLHLITATGKAVKTKAWIKKRV
jgi:hypothetical protein